MPKLFRWCRWNSATFIATLAGAIALVTGASVALANSAVGTAQAANSGSANAVSASTTTSGIAPAMACPGITQLDLASAVPGVPFEIGSATEIGASANTLGNWAACDVKGVIAPQLHFEIKLPRRAGRPTTSRSAAAACAATPASTTPPPRPAASR